eukprot:TRINITY_DN7720_c0_g1_i2.p1 TRINITY_DN7720_c0_g1~~TRINITY_DN7720_c0_g1_i2.p1  ORF type:complete len:111 (+),score=2.63 TRINITY_DN7720_c0_g1_i2:135-467(+)
MPSPDTAPSPSLPFSLLPTLCLPASDLIALHPPLSPDCTPSAASDPTALRSPLLLPTIVSFLARIPIADSFPVRISIPDSLRGFLPRVGVHHGILPSADFRKGSSPYYCL